MVGARLLLVVPVHIVEEVLEDGLLVLYEQVDEVLRGTDTLPLARFLLGGELVDGLQDLDRLEQLAASGACSISSISAATSSMNPIEPT